jgi:exonuclease VII small subunit
LVLNLDRAHICAHDAGGPRFDPLLENPDGWENLILLCRAHHKAVDSWESDYPVEVLRNWKKERESDLGETSEALSRMSDSQFESRITSAFEVGVEGVRDAISEIRGLNEEQIRMLQVLTNRYLEAPELDPHSASELFRAAYMLEDISLGHYAPMLLRGAVALEELNLHQLSSIVERLENASDLEMHIRRLEAGFDEVGTGVRHQLDGASGRLRDVVDGMDQRFAEFAAESTRLVDADHGARMLKFGFFGGIGLCVAVAILIAILGAN